MRGAFRMDDKTNIPKFSIIIPAYNAEKFIHIAVKSVLEQTVKDWELIIVENGSTDNTTDVCAQFLNDKRIKLFHSEKGVSEARNTGIKAAKGKWLVFLDADDRLLIDSLQRYTEIDEEYSPDLIVGEYEDRSIDYTCEKKVYQGNTLNEYFHISLENPTQKCNVTAVAFRKCVVQNNRILFDCQIKYAEDSVFFLETLKYAERLVSLFSPVYRVTYYSQSTVRSGKRKLDKEYLPAINRIRTVLDMNEPVIKNEWYIFILNQLLIIFVNDIFARPEPFLTQLKDAKEAMEIPEYKNAIVDVEIPKNLGLKRIVFRMMKKRFMIGIMLAVRVRQGQNKKKENTFYV